MEAAVDDDFANQLSVIFPPVVFEQVSNEDYTLLCPIYLVMYSLSVDIHTQARSPVEFLPIALDATIGEYTMVVNYEGDFKISFRLLQALWSANPARIRSMRLEPYKTPKTQRWVLRLIVKVISLHSALIPRSFGAYLRSDKTLVRPGFNSKTAAELTVSNDAIQEETNLIERITSICEKMVKPTSVIKGYETTIKPISDCISTQRNYDGSATVRWTLPDYGGVDIIAASVLWAEIGTAVDDICFAMLQGNDKEDKVNLYVDIYLFSPAAPTLRLVSTHHYSYYIDPNKTDDPWKVEVTGPYHMDAYEAESSKKTKRRSSAKGDTLASVTQNIIMNPPSRKRLRPQSLVLPETPVSSPVAQKHQRRQPESLTAMDIISPEEEKKESSGESSSSSDEDSDEKEDVARPTKRQKLNDGTAAAPSSLSNLWNSLPSISIFSTTEKNGTKKKKDEKKDSSSSSSSSEDEKKRDKKKPKKDKKKKSSKKKSKQSSGHSKSKKGSKKQESSDESSDSSSSSSE